MRAVADQRVVGNVIKRDQADVVHLGPHEGGAGVKDTFVFGVLRGFAGGALRGRGALRFGVRGKYGLTG